MNCSNFMPIKRWLLILILFFKSAFNENMNRKRTISKSIHQLFDCPRQSEHRSNIQLCASSSSAHARSKHLEKCDSLLLFSVRRVVIHICIRHSQIFHSNATASFILNHSIKSYSISQDGRMSDIKSYFSGSIVISTKTTFPFNGEISSSNMIGKSFIREWVLILRCQQFKLYHHRDICYQCQVFCENPHLHLSPLNRESETNSKTKILLHKDPILFHQFASGFDSSRILLKPKPNLKLDPNSDKLTCSLHLVSDHLFYLYSGDGDLTRTINKMLDLVNKVNTVFNRNFGFNPNEQKGLKLKFIVRHVTVFRTNKRYGNSLGAKILTADEYLKDFSLYDFNSVCLGIGFTFRNFKGVVGTAFPAVAMPGGICEERMKINSHHVSYNTVIISSFSRIGSLSETTLALTLTHELGHSLGAGHDTTNQCLPPDIQHGSYIMTETLKTGNQSNNYLFSTCSQESMLSVINNRKHCLTPLADSSLSPLCGNSVIEEGEECDCGNQNDCDNVDRCCNPIGDIFHKPCTIRRHIGKQCSPKVNSVCCNHLCMYKTNTSNPLCEILKLKMTQDILKRHNDDDGH